MIVKEFRQKKGNKYRNFILYQDRISVDTKTSKESSRYNVKLSDVGTDLHYHAAHTSKLPIAIFCGIILSLIATILIMDEKHKDTVVAVFMSFILIIVAIIAYLREIIDDVYLVGGSKNLLFYRNVPDEQSVIEFIDEIKRTQKQLFKARYITYTSHTSTEEYEARLQWLKSIDAISDDEYSELLHDFEISKLIQ